MTDPSAPRPVPAPGRPAQAPVESGVDRSAGLDARPVAEHVEVFEAEHDRLQSELGTIDRV